MVEVEYDCTVIMPCFNSKPYIGKSIESVLEQTFTSWELLIVDDCSTDGSADFIRKSFVELDSRIKLVQLDKNSGAAIARNRGIDLAKGRFIAFLDSDDRWTPDKLEIQLSFMKRNNFAFTFTGYEKLDEKGAILNYVGAPHRINYRELLKSNVIGCLSAVYDTQQLGKVYMPLIRKRQDFGLWLRLLKMTPCAHGLNKCLAFYTVRENSISSNKGDAARYTWKLYREFERLSLFKSMYYFSHYVVRGVIRSKYPYLARRMGLLT